MARYRRRRFRPRRRVSRRTNRARRAKGQVAWWDRPTTVAKLASSAWSTGKKLISMLNTECKFHDTTVSMAPIIAGAQQSLLDIPQGDTGITRDGRSVRLKSVQGRIRLTQDALASSTFIRLVLLADTRPNAAEPAAPSDFLQNGTTAPITDLMAKDVGGRFLTLYDKVFLLKASQTQISAADSRVTAQKFIKFYYKMDKVLKYTGTATDDPENYNLLLVSFSSEATNSPDIDGFCRVCFIDN